MVERLAGYPEPTRLPRVFSQAEPIYLRKGRSFPFTDEPNTYHGVQRGTIALFVVNTKGKRALSYLAQPGDFYNPSSFSVPGYGLTEEGLSDSLVYSTKINFLAGQDSLTTELFFRNQAQIFRRQHELEEILVFGQVHERIAYIARLIGNKVKLKDQDVYNVPISQVLLAELVGASRQEVNKKINEWRDRKIILSAKQERRLMFQQAAVDKYINGMLRKPRV